MNVELLRKWVVDQKLPPYVNSMQRRMILAYSTGLAKGEGKVDDKTVQAALKLFQDIDDDDLQYIFTGET